MKRFTTYAIFSFAIAFTLISFTFHKKDTPVANGSIHGYVLPKFSRPVVEIVVPKPNKPEDSIHKSIKLDKEGYFQINNLTPATYQLIFMAKEKGYKKQIKYYSVESGADVDAGRIFLERFID